MSKQNPLRAFILSASALAILCLLAPHIMAQKTPNTVSGAPLKGVDVKLGKNPGGSAAARTFTTDGNGKIVVSDLEPGSYYLMVVGPSKPKTKANQTADGGDAIAADHYLVEITGLVGGPLTREWNGKEKKFVTVQPKATTRATPAAPSYEEKFNFEVGGSPTPLLIFVTRSKSNISNN